MELPPKRLQALELSEQEKRLLRALLLSEGWAVVRKVLHYTEGHLVLKVLHTLNEREALYHKGIWKGHTGVEPLLERFAMPLGGLAPEA